MKILRKNKKKVNCFLDYIHYWCVGFGLLKTNEYENYFVPKLKLLSIPTSGF